jgi:hypothetical protein
MANTYVKIASVSVGLLGSPSITFTSIPSTYTDLTVFLSARTDRLATVADNTIMKINSSTSSYSARVLQGDGSAASSFTDTNQPPFFTFTSTAVNATSNTFGSVFIYLPNYAGSTNKSYSVDSVSENNATSAFARLSAGLLSNTAAISSLTFTNDGGANFIQYSTATLYGISKS